MLFDICLFNVLVLFFCLKKMIIIEYTSSPPPIFQMTNYTVGDICGYLLKLTGVLFLILAARILQKVFGFRSVTFNNTDLGQGSGFLHPSAHSKG